MKWVHLCSPKKNILEASIIAVIIGSFSIDDSEGSENVTFKMNQSRFFKLCRAYSKLLKMSNFPGVDFLGTTLKFWKGKKNSLLLVSYVLHKSWIRDFHAVVVQWRQRDVQKKCAIRVVLLIKPIAFLKFSFPSPSSLLKLSIDGDGNENQRQKSNRLRIRKFTWHRTGIFDRLKMRAFRCSVFKF